MKLVFFESLAEVIAGLPPEIVGDISSLVLILQAAGILLIAYIIFLIISGYFNIRRTLLLKRIDKRLIVRGLASNNLTSTIHGTQREGMVFFSRP